MKKIVLILFAFLLIAGIAILTQTNSVSAQDGDTSLDLAAYCADPMNVFDIDCINYAYCDSTHAHEQVCIDLNEKYGTTAGGDDTTTTNGFTPPSQG